MNRTKHAFPVLGQVTLAVVAAIHIPAVAQTLPHADSTTREVPAFVPSPIEVGDALMVHQRYQAAIEAYRRAPADSAEAWNKMGVAYQLMRNVNEASRSYEKALKLNPHGASYINNLGSIYMEHKEYSRAVKMFRKAAKYNAQSALFEKNLGTALLAQRKYKDGWTAYQRALALDPDIFTRSLGSVRVENPSTIENRGAMNFYLAKACVKAGRFPSAVEHLRMALNEGFTNPRKVMADPEFEPLLNFPQFEKMMAAQTTLTAASAERVTLIH